ncbi:MAG: M1 family metallopeptidase [Kofleriaceae bacterium]
MRWFAILLAVCAAVAPAAALRPDPSAVDRRIDEHSFSEPDVVRTRHLALDLRADFEARQLVGTATLDLAWLGKDRRKLVLDTRDLVIEKVEGRTGRGAWRTLRFELGAVDPHLGQPLVIALDQPCTQVRIAYRTQPQASGLQWLPAQITADGKHPFLFTQSQAIHARSWVPLQDTSRVRFTYAAHIATPPDLMAVMSANNDPRAVRDGDYRFEMPQPIPSYLLALAVGDLVFKPISKRSGVWAEPSVVDGALAEFADTEKMIQVAEKLYGPYRWGRYDLLILPASFPFGGMENPRLSFITPTVIAGDKSLVGMIAHELAHSWSGNLVTSATWKDLWLNEGFTSYVENRIVESVYGLERAEMEKVLSQGELRRRVKDHPEPRQLLRQRAMKGLDPEEGSSVVAYEKGAWFLATLERRFGRARFDAFLRRWFDRHAFQSVTTEDFVAFLRRDLMANRRGAFSEAELTDWLDRPGVPASAIPTVSTRLNAVGAARKLWLHGAKRASQLGTTGWSTQEWAYFLDGMPDQLTHAQLSELDKAYKLTGTRNAEIAERWYPLAIRSGYREARPAIAAFVEKIGRRKLVLPIYRALVASPDGLVFARETFARVRANYHPITATTVEEILAAAAPAQRK